MPLRVPAWSKLGRGRPSAPRRTNHGHIRYVGQAAAATSMRSRSDNRPSDNLEQFGFKREMTRHYILGKLIGAGTFGTVYEATCRRSGRLFAVKTIHKRFLGEYLEKNFVRRVHHEVDIYMHMGNSLNVAHLYDVYEDDSCVDLIMERCLGGDLWTRIRKGDYSEEDGARIVREVLRTVSQFHAQGVVLRDVKPENFLFATSDRDSHLKAIDFGIAQYCGPSDTLTERAGTPVYVAPVAGNSASVGTDIDLQGSEVLKMEYGHKADIWSAGILAYQLLTGRLPFIGDNGLLVSRLYMTKQIFSNKDVFRAILYADLDFTGQPWDEISRDAKDLVHKLLARDASRRPTAAEALSHPWFQALDVAQAAPSAQSAWANGAKGNGGASGEAGEDDGATPVSQRSALLDTVVQRLQRFGTYGRLKQAALRGIANVAVSVADDVSMLEEIRSTFEKLDERGDGRVPYATFVEYLRSGGFELTETEKDVLISQMDVEQAGYIKYDEWLAAMLEWQQLQQCEQWEQWVGEAFAAFDTDGAGRISRAGLNQMLCSGEQCAMPDTIAAALREADKDRDGGISLDEFLHLVNMSSADCLSNFEGRRPRS